MSRRTTFCLLLMGLLSPGLADIQLPAEFPYGEEDPFEYRWRNKVTEARLQDYLRLLSAPPRHRPHRGDEPGAAPLGQYPPLPPAPSFSYSIPEVAQAPESQPETFAVPPSDQRFFLQKPPQPQEAVPETEDVRPERPEDKKEDDDEKQVEESEGGTEKSEDGLVEPQVLKTPLFLQPKTREIVEVAAMLVVMIGTLAGIGYGAYRLHKSNKAAAEVEYPAYGVTGPNKDTTPTGDRRLAHSAQMYHYQLTKQQIIAMESSRGSTAERRGSVSEADSDEDNEEGDYTVYECPGLAPTGEMEVKNPLFVEEATPGLVEPKGAEPPKEGGQEGEEGPH